MAKRQKKATYTGVLADPIKLPKDLQTHPLVKVLSCTPDELISYMQQQAKFISDQRLDRVHALFKHYGIDASDLSSNFPWLALVSELAEAHVPGFSVANQPEWAEETEYDRFEVWCEVKYKMLKQRTSSVQAACSSMSKSGPFKGRKVQALRRDYARVAAIDKFKHFDTAPQSELISFLFSVGKFPLMEFIKPSKLN